MAAVEMVLILLLAVVVSRIVARISPFDLPLPLLQIGIGALLSYMVGFEVRLDPDVFFLLLLAPLLFLDGWRISKQAFYADWRPILTLALGLVVFTVIGVGSLVHLWIPAMPLAVAFALAAILSPTDPVAVSSVSAGAPMPLRLMHILEGEALLNDASGLVCFRFAVAAALTGSFSLSGALLSFAKTAGGGLAIGVAISFLACAAYRWLSRWTGEEPGTSILIGLLLPFAAYLAAEHLQVSGILAAVAAGVSVHYAYLLVRVPAITRMRGHAVWDMLQLALNGVIFVLLGDQLPGVLNRLPAIARATGGDPAWQLFAYIAATTVALALLRFAWISASFEIARALAMLRGATSRRRPTLRFLGVAALAGVRGAVTLAGILTLPVAMPDGSPFPARELAIFLAAGVILLSLVMASIGLSLLASGRRVSDHVAASDQAANARSAAAEAAIRRVEEMRDKTSSADGEVEAEAAARVVGFYQRRLEEGRDGGDGAAAMRRVADTEHHLMIAAVRAERDELYRLRLSRVIDDDLHWRLVREVDLREASLASQRE